jgi:hypothetical protein
MHFEFLMLLIMNSPSWLLFLDESDNIQVQGRASWERTDRWEGPQVSFEGALSRTRRIADSEGRGGASTF